MLQKIPSHFHFRCDYEFFLSCSPPIFFLPSDPVFGASVIDVVYIDPKKYLCTAVASILVPVYYYTDCAMTCAAASLFFVIMYILFPRNVYKRLSICFIFIYSPPTDLSRASAFVFTVCILHTHTHIHACMYGINTRIGNENRLYCGDREPVSPAEEFLHLSNLTSCASGELRSWGTHKHTRPTSQLRSTYITLVRDFVELESKKPKRPCNSGPTPCVYVYALCAICERA